jgi:hypothetical protein
MIAMLRRIHTPRSDRRKLHFERWTFDSIAARKVVADQQNTVAREAVEQERIEFALQLPPLATEGISSSVLWEKPWNSD